MGRWGESKPQWFPETWTRLERWKLIDILMLVMWSCTEQVKLQSLARERWFLLRLKSKYAGVFNISIVTLLQFIWIIIIYVAGQSIAIRLSRRFCWINVVTKQLKAKISEYNSNNPPSGSLTWEDVTYAAWYWTAAYYSLLHEIPGSPTIS